MKGIAAVAAMFADESRIAMLDVLLDGDSHSVGELARAAGVAPSTASEHLARLAQARLVEAKREGRRRLYVLADASVAAALEALGPLAETKPPTGLRESSRMQLLRHGRTCYDHLAGRLGVALSDAAQSADALNCDLSLGGRANDWFAELGVRIDELPRGRRPLLRVCVDWTERREHLAGALGAALCAGFFSRDWIVRIPSTRAVRMTSIGEQGFRDLGITIEA